MKTKNIPSGTETVEITNFGGRLTRVINGDLNSGFAKYSTSYGYNPFTKPGNLTWIRGPINNTSSAPSTFTGLVTAGKSRFESRDQYVYLVDDTGKLYKFTAYSRGSPPGPSSPINSVVGTADAAGYTSDFTAGASIEFFGAPEQILVGTNTQVNRVNFDGSAASVVGASANYYAYGVGRPLKPFAGGLLFANGNTIGKIDATRTVTSSIIGTGLGAIYSQLNPPLPVEYLVKDLDVSIDYNYLKIATSTVPADVTLETAGDDASYAALGDSATFVWNGTDQGTTGGQQMPAQNLSALHSYLDQEIYFSSDAFGATLGDGVKKLLTLPNTKPPLPNATAVNGNFLTWVTPELDSTGTALNASLFYFGSLDQENPVGLYRLFKVAPTLSSGYMYQTPFNLIPSGMYSNVYPNKTGVGAQAYGMHLLSFYEVSSSSSSKKFMIFYVTPINSNVNANEGVYETQTQLWSKKISVKQIRVYTEPTVAGNGFQIDIVGTDGNVLTNGTFTYSYTAGTDQTLLQGSQERINFNPSMTDIYGFGIRVTNTGTVNETIKKIEVDWNYAGK